MRCSVRHTPQAPARGLAPGTDVTVTALVELQQGGAPLQAVSVEYLVGGGGLARSLAMTPATAASDGDRSGQQQAYTATIPGAALKAGSLLRWRVKVRRRGGRAHKGAAPVYTPPPPTQTLHPPHRLLWWSLQATDNSGAQAMEPAPGAPPGKGAEYLGLAVEAAGAANQTLPILYMYVGSAGGHKGDQLQMGRPACTRARACLASATSHHGTCVLLPRRRFADNATDATSTNGASASLFWNGTYFDNVEAQRKGVSTLGWVSGCTSLQQAWGAGLHAALWLLCCWACTSLRAVPRCTVAPTSPTPGQAQAQVLHARLRLLVRQCLRHSGPAQSRC